jgi:hypothetical protein
MREAAVISFGAKAAAMNKNKHKLWRIFGVDDVVSVGKQNGVRRTGRGAECGTPGVLIDLAVRLHGMPFTS